MTSLDKAMKMLLVAQNIIHEQEAKIKLLKYKHRKMKSKIYSLEQFIETAPLIKTERTHRKVCIIIYKRTSCSSLFNPHHNFVQPVFINLLQA